MKPEVLAREIEKIVVTTDMHDVALRIVDTIDPVLLDVFLTRVGHELEETGYYDEDECDNEEEDDYDDYDDESLCSGGFL